MENSLEIKYTPRAKETLISVYQFIFQKFGQKAAEKFVIKAEKTIALLAKQPFMFKASNIDEKVRVGLITKRDNPRKFTKSFNP